MDLFRVSTRISSLFRASVRIFRASSRQKSPFQALFGFALTLESTKGNGKIHPSVREERSRKPMDEQALRQMSTEILTDIKEWRRANPRATYVEIEDEVHKRLMQLEARLIEGAVEESPSREWGRGSGVDAAQCPKCAVSLQARGKQKRTLQGNGGQNVILSRTYGTCPKCGESLFPPR